jgi:hypothetical protein
VGNAGGIVEAAICYTGDVTRGLTDKDYKYNLDYYVDFAEKLMKRHIHVLCIKDMVRSHQFGHKSEDACGYLPVHFRRLAFSLPKRLAS